MKIINIIKRLFSKDKKQLSTMNGKPVSRVINRSKKNIYKLQCLLMYEDKGIRKINFSIKAYSKNQAEQAVLDKIKIKIIKTNRL